MIRHRLAASDREFATDDHGPRIGISATRWSRMLRALFPVSIALSAVAALTRARLVWLDSGAVGIAAMVLSLFTALGWARVSSFQLNRAPWRYRS